VKTEIGQGENCIVDLVYVEGHAGIVRIRDAHPERAGLWMRKTAAAFFDASAVRVDTAQSTRAVVRPTSF
jgi:hypothetical protein